MCVCGGGGGGGGGPRTAASFSGLLLEALCCWLMDEVPLEMALGGFGAGLELLILLFLESLLPLYILVLVIGKSSSFRPFCYRSNARNLKIAFTASVTNVSCFLSYSFFMKLFPWEGSVILYLPN